MGAEERPRSFRARIGRRARSRAVGAGARKRQTGRLAVLAAAIAVPAMAAPGSGESEARYAPIAAEQVVPSSEMIQLASLTPTDGAQAPADFLSQIHSDGDEPRAAMGVLDPGPAARALMAAGSATDRMRAQQCLSMAIYYEAASESDDGQRAVAQVVLNRVAHPAYPNTVCGVVFQGSERTTGCQFTFTCDGSLRRQPSAAGYARASRIARAALAGSVYAQVGLATHYHTLQVHPYWADSLRQVATIGAHRFYRWPGVAGTSGAFLVAAYRGSEPEARPHAAQRSVRYLDAQYGGATDAFEGSARIEFDAAADVIDAGSARTAELASEPGIMPASGTVKAGYETSGQWLKRP